MDVCAEWTAWPSSQGGTAGDRNTALVPADVICMGRELFIFHDGRKAEERAC